MVTQNGVFDLTKSHVKVTLPTIVFNVPPETGKVELIIEQQSYYAHYLFDVTGKQTLNPRGVTYERK